MAKQTPAPPFPFADDEIVVCLESFSGYPNITVSAGARLRGNHEAVRKWPKFFAPDGLSVDEMHRLAMSIRPEIQYAQHEPMARHPAQAVDVVDEPVERRGGHLADVFHGLSVADEAQSDRRHR